jgi:hypothetical protein
VQSRVAAPILGAGLALLILLEAQTLATTWLPEEAVVAEQARDGSFLGAVAGVYPLTLRPAADRLAAGAFLDLVRLLSGLCWLAIWIPAYSLARRESSRRVAAGAAALSLLIPAAVYATTLLPEAPATLLAASALALFVRASDRVDRRLLAGAFACAITAALLRPWFAVLPVALAVAAARRRIPLRALVRWPLPLAFGLLCGAAVIGLGGVSAELDRALGQPGEVLRAAVASVAVAALGAGLLPWVLAWATVLDRRDAAADLLAVATPALALAAGLTAVDVGYLADERALVPLGPLVFALALVPLRAGLREPRFVLAAGGALALTMLALPSVRPDPALVHAPGLELAWSAAAAAGLQDTAAAALLLLLTVALAAAFALGRTAALWVALVGVLVFAGHVAAWRQVEIASSREAELLPDEPSVIDAHVDAEGAVAAILSPTEPVPDSLRQLALWNRSLGPLVRVDLGAANSTSGALSPMVSTPFALAQNVELAGRAVARTAAGTLTRLEPPFRLAVSTEGIYPDGWSGERAVYRRFSGPQGPGTVALDVSRRGWTGPDVPGSVVIEAGPLGRPRPLGGLVVHSGQQHNVNVPVPPPPFEIVVTVEPTFSPADFGQSDDRRLGAQLTFTYVPAADE